MIIRGGNVDQHNKGGNMWVSVEGFSHFLKDQH